MPVTASDTITFRGLSRATLARQLLLERAKLPVAQAVERVGPLQAQDPWPPFVALWTRLEGFERQELLQALHDRSVVRATFLRATLHIVGAADFAAQRGAIVPVLTKGVKLLGDRAAGLEQEPVLAAARELLEQAPRTFAELRELLEERFPTVNDRALGHTVRMLLPLVMEPTDDAWGFARVSRFALAEPWLGMRLADDETPDELVLRYLAAFGPATAADIQTWSGLKGMAAVLKRLRPDLLVLRSEAGKELFDLPDAPRPADDTPAPARLLPPFDSLLLAHADRSRLIDDEHRSVVVSKNLRVAATMLVDGRVEGTWAASRTTRAAKLDLRPFGKLTKHARAELEAEGARLLEFTDPGLSHEVQTV
jgi:hypothetical protein